jgi:hypothetical protein
MLGASAVDNVDGDIPARIVTIIPVDTSRAGQRVGSNDMCVLALLGVVGSLRRLGGQRDG